MIRDEKISLSIVRAETPGRFTALPTQVSAMYAPELRANSADWRARVE
jgi:uncharacterized protein YfaS (alpha-2-macroglobulin family)